MNPHEATKSFLCRERRLKLGVLFGEETPIKLAMRFDHIEHTCIHNNRIVLNINLAYSVRLID